MKLPDCPKLGRSSRVVSSLLSLMAAVFLLAACSSNEPSPLNYVEPLDSPRGLAPLADGNMLIAEGGAGRLLLLDNKNRISVLQDNLPRLLDGPEGEPVGISAAIEMEGTYYYIIGEARAKGFREVYSLTPGSPPKPLTGQDPLGIDHPNPLTNPYDLVASKAGGLLISDAGANAVWHVTLDGDITLFATLEAVSYTADDGTAQTQPVPTGMARGPDGAVYVATLTGFPFPSGAANIIRLEDTNGDGDALDEGESTVYASGFTAATDVAFEPDGSMLVTEYSQNMRELAASGFGESSKYSGRLLRWRDGGFTVVATGLVSPTAVAVMNGRIYVSEEFAGQVRIIEP